MNKKVLILGASGNFGSKIAKRLAKANIAIIIAGRQIASLITLQNEVQKINPDISVEIVTFDIKKEIAQQLAKLQPFIVINTCGPFQEINYSVARNCVERSIHYIDIADGRDFVNGIHDALDSFAHENHCLIVSGASTIPCLSSAVLEHYKHEFKVIDSLIYGVAPGQKSDRGLAVTQAVLSQIGRPLKPILGSIKTIYGWQGLYRQIYPVIGKRWMAYCDIPDLDLFPKYYGIKHIKFSAGIESTTLHLILWILSWCIRWGLPLQLERHAKLLLKLSHSFDYFGSDSGGMHMIIHGKDKNNNLTTIKWFIIAQDGHGPYIPITPVIILAKKLIHQKIKQFGAMPCIKLISLEEYLDELSDLNIHVYSEVPA